jgi:hypothetical protein|tara:strand:- start:586 stop:789 length:204 start_codon:yes stop_codon:yes gene_type:complete
VKDIFTAMFTNASVGSFIKDLTQQKRSLGFVLAVDDLTNMMQVRFPKISQDSWIVWGNHGHYKVIES